MRHSSAILLSALALALSSNQRSEHSERLMSRLHEAVKEHEAMVVDPTASVEERKEAWDFFSGHVCSELFKGSPGLGNLILSDDLG